MSLLSNLHLDNFGPPRARVELFEQHCHVPDFLGSLIAFSASPELERQATWLIKRYLEKDMVTTPQESSAIIALLGTVTAWESHLHLLQSIRHLTIPEASQEKCLASLRSLILHRRNFVRDWAFDALHTLAEQSEACRTEALQAFSLAHDDSAASVQARIRNIVKANQMSSV